MVIAMCLTCAFDENTRTAPLRAIGTPRLVAGSCEVHVVRGATARIARNLRRTMPRLIRREARTQSQYSQSLMR